MYRFYNKQLSHGDKLLNRSFYARIINGRGNDLTTVPISAFYTAFSQIT